jgi:hypothetical protein
MIAMRFDFTVNFFEGAEYELYFRANTSVPPCGVKCAVESKIKRALVILVRHAG